MLLRKVVLTGSALLSIVILLTSFVREVGRQPNVPTEVAIGSQVWMTENLSVDEFRNGDLIPHANTREEWLKAGAEKQPAWCYYDNNPSNGEKYGKLYNWYAVIDPRGLAPKGWHIPSDNEWSMLIKLLGWNEAGEKLKSTSGWGKNGNGTNELGFLGLPSGLRSNQGVFLSKGEYGYWWSSTNASRGTAWYRAPSCYANSVNRFWAFYELGLSVRCVKD